MTHPIHQVLISKKKGKNNRAKDKSITVHTFDTFAHRKSCRRLHNFKG